MSDYVSRKWGKNYRCKAWYDLETGEYLRNPDGSLDTENIYIDCKNGDIIVDYDSKRSIMEAYVSSKQRGRRIVSEIYNEEYGDFDRFVTMTEFTDGNNEEKERKNVDWDGFFDYINSLKISLIHDIDELDNELTFKFNGNKHMDTIARHMEAKKPMSITSPFNVKYLPKHKEKMALKRANEERYVKYTDMPSGYWDVMRQEIVPYFAKKYSCRVDEALEKCYKLFSKHKKKNYIKLADENNYKINHYLHKEGLWDEFISFLKSNLEDK